MQTGAIKVGQNVVVLDDLIGMCERMERMRSNYSIDTSIPLATGGSAKAAGELIKQNGGTTLRYIFIVELTALKGTEKLDAPTYSLVQFDD